ncbi:hypothetical protein HDV05_007552 [Chytridiales sp. JEL 0842]|nr:hypothetical protein HDV05_007552 [Chytridiales sp. JEL 0842]
MPSSTYLSLLPPELQTTILTLAGLYTQHLSHLLPSPPRTPTDSRDLWASFFDTHLHIPSSSSDDDVAVDVDSWGSKWGWDGFVDSHTGLSNIHCLPVFAKVCRVLPGHPLLNPFQKNSTGTAEELKAELRGAMRVLEGYASSPGGCGGRRLKGVLGRLGQSLVHVVLNNEWVGFGVEVEEMEEGWGRGLWGCYFGLRGLGGRYAGDVLERFPLLSKGVVGDGGSGLEGCWLPTTVAASKGNGEVLEMLVEKGFGVNAKCLLEASRNNHPHVVSYLLSTFPFLRTQKRESINAASENGHLGVLKLLLRNGTEGLTSEAMDKACAQGHLPILRFLFTHPHHPTQISPTHVAVDSASTNGHLHVLQYLHKTNFDAACSEKAMDNAPNFSILLYVHTHFPQARFTHLAIEKASGRGDLEALEYLTRLRPDLVTPLAFRWGSRGGHVRVLEHLGKLVGREVVLGGVEVAGSVGVLRFFVERLVVGGGEEEVEVVGHGVTVAFLPAWRLAWAGVGRENWEGVLTGEMGVIDLEREVEEAVWRDVERGVHVGVVDVVGGG